MRVRGKLFLVGLLALTGCPSSPAPTDGTGDSHSDGTGTGAPAPGTGEAAGTGQAPAQPATRPAEPGPDTFENGVFRSPRFNVSIRIPETWHMAAEGEGSGGPWGLAGGSDDSVAFIGPEGAGIRMIVANTESVQLAGASFSSLDDRVGFDNVNILPERTEGRTFNGVRGYRTEGDALLRGEGTPIYFIAQALELPGRPTMVTIFIPGTNYFEHSDVMKAVLDSIEVLDLRPQ